MIHWSCIPERRFCFFVYKKVLLEKEWWSLCWFCKFLLGFIIFVSLCYALHGVSQVALVVKNLPAHAGDIRDVDSIPGPGRSPGGGPGESHGQKVAKSQIWLKPLNNNKALHCGIVFLFFFLIFACFGSNSSPKSPARLSWAGLASQCCLHVTLKKGLLRLFAFIEKCRTIWNKPLFQIHSRKNYTPTTDWGTLSFLCENSGQNFISHRSSINS